jgi:uncharacterized damage-inducible protein DinB
MKRVRQAGEPLLSKRMNFCVGKNKVRSASVGEIFWFFLHDHIHHRGQLSVYLRLVGAKVPPIYGPSADEPW